MQKRGEGASGTCGWWKETKRNLFAAAGLERRTSCSWPRGDAAEPRLGAAGGGEHKLAREGEVRGGERSDVGGLLRDRLVGEQR